MESPRLPAQHPSIHQANQAPAATPVHHVDLTPGMANAINGILGIMYLQILPPVNPAAFQVMQPEGPLSTSQQPAIQSAAPKPQVFQPGAENPLWGS